MAASCEVLWDLPRVAPRSGACHSSVRITRMHNSREKQISKWCGRTSMTGPVQQTEHRDVPAGRERGKAVFEHGFNFCKPNLPQKPASHSIHDIKNARGSVVESSSS